MPADPDAFLTALRPHYADALRYCRGLCARWSPSHAEDAFQSALLAALEGFGGLRDRERFRPWLFRIVTREVRKAQRRSVWRRFAPLPPDDVAGPLGLVTAPASGEAHDLLAALAGLGRREREALLLFEVGGFSVDEIRAVQGDRSASAVKSRLARARARLRARLDDPVPVPALSL
ncbi:RNA polymerase sigma factor [Rubrivirga sp. IMCC45206]|uniref:RNA polymerase sigma factor n=1 Tax=Rubrivirga sp. IMCC45206 TaxID=3391614 RepID=UPI0039901C88